MNSKREIVVNIQSTNQILVAVGVMANTRVYRIIVKHNNIKRGRAKGQRDTHPVECSRKPYTITNEVKKNQKVLRRAKLYYKTRKFNLNRRRREKSSQRKPTFLETQFVKFGTFIIVESPDGNARLTIIDQGFVGVFVPFFFLKWIPFRSARPVAHGWTSAVVLISVAAAAASDGCVFVARTANRSQCCCCGCSNDRTTFRIFRATFPAFIQTWLGRSGFLNHTHRPPKKKHNSQQT